MFVEVVGEPFSFFFPVVLRIIIRESRVSTSFEALRVIII
jgi:hypothetical protein